MSAIRRLRRLHGYFEARLGARMYLVVLMSALAATMEAFGLSTVIPLVAYIELGDVVPVPDVYVRGVEYVRAVGIDPTVPALLLLLIAIYIARAALKFATDVYLNKLIQVLNVDMRRDFLISLERVRYEHFQRHSSGHFINLFVGQIQAALTTFLASLKLAVSVCAAGIYILSAVLLNWSFALSAILLGCVALSAFRFVNLRVLRLSSETAQKAGQVNHLLLESLGAFKYGIATGVFGKIREHVNGAVVDLSQNQFRLAKFSAFTGAAQEPIAIVALVFAVAIQAGFTGSGIASILISSLLLYRGLQAFVTLQVHWQTVASTYGGFQWFVTEQQRLHDHVEAEQTGDEQIQLERGIEFCGVTFSYGEGERRILDEADVMFEFGRITALTGPSGVGKSTVLDLITRIHRPLYGEVRVDGHAIQSIDLTCWRSQIGYYSQDAAVFNDTIANNIGLWGGDFESNEDYAIRVRRAATLANIAQFVEETPYGYNTIVGERGTGLSGGQRQRLFLARELFKQPRLLILDEATSALDADSERIVNETVSALAGEMAVLIVSHRESSIAIADVQYELSAGKFVRLDAPAEVCNREAT